MTSLRKWQLSLPTLCLLLALATPGSAFAQGTYWWPGDPMRQRFTVPNQQIFLQSSDLGPRFNILDQIQGSDVNQRDRSGSSGGGASRSNSDKENSSKDCDKDKSLFRTHMSVIDKTLRRLEKGHKLKSPAKDEAATDTNDHVETELSDADRIFATREWKKLFEAEVAKAGLKTLDKGDRRTLRSALKTAFAPEVISSRGLNRAEVVKKLTGLTEIVATVLTKEAAGKWIDVAKGVLGLLNEPIAQASGSDEGVSSDEVLSSFAKTVDDALVETGAEKPAIEEGGGKETSPVKLEGAGEVKVSPKTIDWSPVLKSLKEKKLADAAAATAANEIDVLAQVDLPKGLSRLERTKVRLLDHKVPGEEESWAAARREILQAIETAKIGTDDASSVWLSNSLASLADGLRRINGFQIEWPAQLKGIDLSDKRLKQAVKDKMLEIARSQSDHIKGQLPLFYFDCQFASRFDRSAEAVLPKAMENREMYLTGHKALWNSFCKDLLGALASNVLEPGDDNISIIEALHLLSESPAPLPPAGKPGG